MLEGVLAWLIRHPTTIALALLALVAAGSSATARYEMHKAARLEQELNTATATLQKVQQSQQQVEKISHEYEVRVNVLNHKLAVARMQHPVCVVLSGTTPAGSNGSAPTGLVGQVGVNSSWADELIAEGQHYADQLSALQQYVATQCRH